MRRIFVTGLVALQAGLGDSLPHLASRVDDETLLPKTWKQATPATFRLDSFPDDTHKPAVVYQTLPFHVLNRTLTPTQQADLDPSVTDHDPSAPLDDDLNRELTELRALRAQLAELAKEISAREKWLAAAAVSGTTMVTDHSSSSIITDCESLPCALQVILRKTKYGLSALFSYHDDDDKSDESNDERNRTATVIPLLPWRKPGQNAASGDADGHVGGDSDSSSSADSSRSRSSVAGEG